MLCRNCNTENAETAKFCVNCGQALAAPVGQQTTPPQATTAGEVRRVLSLVAGAIVFYVGLAIVSVVTDWELPADKSVSGTYIGSWFLGAGLSSGFGVEMATRVAANFNRIGLILLMVAPLAFLAIGIFFAADHFSSRTIEIVLCALLGSAVGLGVTFRDLMKSKGAAHETSNLRS
jgi:hypothetical protein